MLPEGDEGAPGGPPLLPELPRPPFPDSASSIDRSRATPPASVHTGRGRFRSLRSRRPSTRPVGPPYGRSGHLVLVALVSLSLIGSGVGVLGGTFWSSPVLQVLHPQTGASSVEGRPSSLLRQASASLRNGAGPPELRGTNCVAEAEGQSFSCPAQTQSPVPSLSWSPIGSPPGRSAVTMVYDAADGYVVLFSDGSSSSVQGDTWIFQGGQWKELPLAVAPSPRLGAYMAFDSQDGYVLLFGGWGGNSGPSEYGDTWAFAGGSWHLLIPQNSCAGEGGSLPCPSARDSGSMADDPTDGMVILFGGYGGLGDTWGFAGGNWVPLISQTSCTGSGGTTICPSPRADGAMAWDASLSGDVLFGGGGPLNDTWLFRSGSWTQLIASTNCTGLSGRVPCPSPREEASLTYDYADNILLLFGGYNGSADLSDTWAFDAGSWHLLASASGCRSCPAGRSSAGFAYDPSLGGVLLFGGYAYRGDSWSFSGGSWTPVAQTQRPGPRWDASLAWDPLDQVVLLFGGSNGTAFGDTWTYAHGVWSQVQPISRCTASSCPSARSGAALAWDGSDQVMILFGGMTTSSGGFLHDTWSYARGNWSLVISGVSCTSSTCPSARANSSMAWDPVDHEDVLFGGYGTSYDGDTWAFSGDTWSEVLSPTQCGTVPCPSPRESASIATAPPPSSGVVLFGGTTSTGPTNDTWLFTGGAWTDLLSAAACRSQACPSIRSGAAMALDATAGTVGLFGGANGSRTLSDTWVLTGRNWTSVPLYGPSARSFASLAPDPSDGYLLLVGGYSSYGLLPEVWALGPVVQAGTPTATLSPVDVGETTTFDVLVTGAGITTSWTTWQGLPPGCPSPANGAYTLSCVPSVAGTYYVTAVVTFGNGLPGVTSNFLTVSVDPDPTVIVSAHPSTTTLGSPFTLWANASGGTAPFATYLWSGLPRSCSSSTISSSNLSCVPKNDSDLGAWQVRVSVLDATGFNATSPPITLDIEPAPWSVSVQLSPPVNDLGQYEILTAFTSGLNGSATFLWSGLPPGCSGSIGSLLCLPTASGTFGVEVKALATDPADGSQTSSPATLTILPALSVPELVPSSSSIPLGGSLTLRVSESGGDAPYTYLWNGLPPGCPMTDADQVVCVPAHAGTFTPSVEVSDSLGTSSPMVNTTVQVNSTGSAVLLSGSRTLLDVGQSTTLSATAVGAGANGSFQWLGLPQGCKGSSAPVVVCAPLAPGDSSVAVEVTYAPAPPLVSNVVTLSVAPAMSATQILASSSAVQAGSSLVLSVSVAGGTGPYTFQWTGLPAGCIAGETDTFTCIPAQAASYSVSVEVVDGAGATSTATTTILVTPAPSSPSIDWVGVAFSVAAVALAALLLLVIVLGRRRKEPPESAVPSTMSPSRPAGSSSGAPSPDPSPRPIRPAHPYPPAGGDGETREGGRPQARSASLVSAPLRLGTGIAPMGSATYAPNERAYRPVPMDVARKSSVVTSRDP